VKRKNTAFKSWHAQEQGPQDTNNAGKTILPKKPYDVMKVAGSGSVLNQSGSANHGLA
jgi:hypothetical protein